MTRIDSAARLRLLTGFFVAFGTGALVASAVKRAGGWRDGTAWDRAILRHAHTSLPTWVDRCLVATSWLGTNITIFAALIPFSVWLVRRKRIDIAAQLGVVAVGNYLLTLSTKLTFGRPRPSLWPRRGEYTWASFPSGHSIAMLSVLLFAAWLLHRERGTLWGYVVWLPTLVMTLYSRLYLGVHWPTDILGGSAIGVVWFLTIWFTFRQAETV